MATKSDGLMPVNDACTKTCLESARYVAWLKGREAAEAGASLADEFAGE